MDAACGGVDTCFKVKRRWAIHYDFLNDRLFDQMSLQDKELIKMEEAIISKAEGEEKILVELWNELRYYWDKRMKFLAAGKLFRQDTVKQAKTVHSRRPDIRLGWIKTVVDATILRSDPG